MSFSAFYDFNRKHQKFDGALPMKLIKVFTLYSLSLLCGCENQAPRDVPGALLPHKLPIEDTIQHPVLASAADQSSQTEAAMTDSSEWRTTLEVSVPGYGTPDHYDRGCARRVRSYFESNSTIGIPGEASSSEWLFESAANFQTASTDPQHGSRYPSKKTRPD